MPNYVAGVGPLAAKVMIIGEAPGKYENEAQIPFVGPTGQMLDDLIANAGHKRSECFITNVVKYQPPFNDFTKLNLINVDLKESIDKLWEFEINKIKPNVILAVGNEALKAVCNLDGIVNYRGSILKGKDGVQKVVATIHPAALFPKPGKEEGALPYVYKQLIGNDIIRAFEEAGSSAIHLPDRHHVIAHNSLDLYRYYQEYKKLRKTASDIESINCIPVCVGFAFTRHHSITVPLLKQIGPFPLTDMSRREIIECWRIIQDIYSEMGIVGQNFKYDEFKLGLCGFSIPNVVSDTMLKCHTIVPELPDKRLNTISSIWTREPFYKDEGKENKVGKHFNVERFFRYCGKDSCVTIESDEEMEPDLINLAEKFKVPLKEFYYNYIMKKHKTYLKMENRGFAIDFEHKKELKDKYEDLREGAHARLTELVGYDVNVKSTPQMFSLLYEAMKFPKRIKQPTSEDSIIALLGNHCKGKDAKQKQIILETVLEERRIRDQLSRAINFEPDYDGTCKTSFRIEQTETARSSTNILKKPVRPKKVGLAFHTIPKHGRLAKDIRSMLIPRKGKVLLQADLSQAEARIVAVLAEDWALLKAFDEIDIHRRTAAMFFGYTTSLILTPGKLSIVDDLDKDGPERFTGKMFRHAGNYDMGKGRAMNEFNVNAQKYEIPMSISEWRAGQYIELFHAASPKIRAVFHAGIRDCINSTRALVNPYGRPRELFGRLDDTTYKEGYAFIPQSTVADTTQTALLEIDDALNGDVEAGFVSENHDALVLEVPADNWMPYAQLLKKHMVRPIYFGQYCSLSRDFTLTIPVDVEISQDPKTGEITNYGKLYKIKVAA